MNLKQKSNNKGNKHTYIIKIIYQFFLFRYIDLKFKKENIFDYYF